MSDPAAHQSKPTAIKTVADLKRSGYVPRGTREEMRRNLAARLRTVGREAEAGTEAASVSAHAHAALFEGIRGYDDTVLPEIENAVLSGHHMVFLGERGQGKTRLIRSLVDLLDPWVPVVAGCEINDDPMEPVCARCRRLADEQGDSLAIDWLGREDRYGEKLATPDVSIADLIGEIDPVKIAEGRYMSDAEAIHFGIIPRSNRGIFAINELPDLTEKVQVGLFNLMEERDLQIKGHKVRMPLDVVVVATANPEDYTSRGRIVTPLKDRFDVEIRTHYPRTIEDEVGIALAEVRPDCRPSDRLPVRLPDFMADIVARITMEAREAPEISQDSGVSVRVTINNMETLIANAEKRAILCDEREVVPRVTDLPALVASTRGKLEFEYGMQRGGELEIVERLVSRAIKAAFDARSDGIDAAPIVQYVSEGWGVAVSDTMPSAEYLAGIGSIPGMRGALDALGPFESPGLMASAAEFLLEGLHLNEKLNRDREGGRFTYNA